MRLPASLALGLLVLLLTAASCGGDPAPSEFSLSVDKTGSGSGTVTSTPGGIDCGSSCETSYLENAVVTLSAVPDSSAEFGGWTGCDSAAGTTCTVVMTADKNVSAAFGDKTNGNETVYRLEVAKDGSGSGTVTSEPSGINCGSNCSQNYTEGTTITLRAAPAAGSQFSTWNGCANTAGATCTLQMNAAQTVTATFSVEAAPTYELSVTKVGSGSGTVTSNPPGIACGSDCSESFDAGTTVTLSAAPGSGSVLLEWAGCDLAQNLGCTLEADKDRMVTATFVPEIVTRQFGTSSDDFATSVSVDDSGVYVVGYTSGALEGSSAGAFDAFVRVFHRK